MGGGRCSGSGGRCLLGHAGGPVAIAASVAGRVRLRQVSDVAGREVWAVAVSWAAVGAGPVPARR
jgi:hypothetical protein